MANRYWVGGTGTWNTSSTTNWSASSGGAGGASVPTASDSVFFDQAGTYTVTLTGALLCNDFTVSAGTVTFSSTGTPTINGSMSLSASTVWSATGTITFNSNAPGKTITTNGVTINASITLNGIGGAWTLGSALTTAATNTLTLTNGTFSASTYNVTVGLFASNAANYRTLNMGSGVWTISGTGVLWSIASSRLTLNAQTANITLSDTSTTARTFGGGGLIYNKLTIGGATGTSTTTITSSNYFSELASTKTVAHTVTLSGATVTQCGVWSITGTVGNVVTLTAATTAYLSVVTRPSTLNYISATNINAIQAPLFLGTGSSVTTCTNVLASAYVAPFTHYWRGGTGTWDGTTTTNWSNSSGGAGGSAVPYGDEDVIFDSASNATAYTVTITSSSTNYAARCKNLTWNAPASGALSITGSSSSGLSAYVSIFGSLSVASSNVALSPTNYIVGLNFASNVSGNTINLGSLNGTYYFNTNFTGLNGVWTLTNNYTASSGVTTSLTIHTAGTLNTAGYTFTPGTNFTSSGDLPRALNFGASLVSVYTGGTSGAFQLVNSNLTFNAGTSTVCAYTISGNGAQFYALGNNGGILNSIDVTDSCQYLIGTGPSTAGVSIINITRDMPLVGFQTTGTAGNRRVVFKSSTAGTQRTITTTSASTVTDADFQDIVVTGASVSGTRVGNRGSNSGITFDVAKTVYWATAAGGNWSGTNWATSAGGAVSNDNFPLPQDTATFVNTGLNTSATVTLDTPMTVSTTAGLATSGVDMSARTNAMTLATGTVTPTIFGNWTNGSGTTLSGTGAMTFGGRNTQTITSAGKSFTQPITINSVGGTVQLGDALDIGTTNTLTVTQGTFTTNNYNVTAAFLSSSNSSTRTINLGSSTVTLSGSGGSVSFTPTTGLTFNAGTSTIVLSSSVSPGLNISATGVTFYNVSFTGANQTQPQVSGSNTFNNLSMAGRTSAGIKQFVFSANQTINGTLTLSAGTDATMRTFVTSDTIGTTRTLTCAAVATLTDIDFQDITIAGAAAPASGTRLGNCQGNSGITFAAGVNKYWNLAAGGNWGGAVAWATTSGGSPAINNFPLAQDTCIFDSSTATLSSGATVTVNSLYNIGTINMSARTANTMTLTSGAVPNIYGDLINGTGGTITLATPIFAGRTVQNITSAGYAFNQVWAIKCFGGTLKLNDAYTTSGYFDLWYGTIDLNGKTYTSSNSSYNFFVEALGPSNLTFNGGSLVLTGTGSNNFYNAATTGFTTTAGTGTGTISMAGSTATVFFGNGINYNCVLNQGGSGALTISGSNSFQDITNTYSATGATTITLTAGTTQTCTNFTATGSVGKVLTLNTTTSSATLNVYNRPSATNYVAANSIIANMAPIYLGTGSTATAGINVFASAYVAPFTHYWAGGAGNWSIVATTNWSTSSGGSGGAAVPFGDENVVFDQAGTYTVTCSGALTCRDITVSAGTVTFADGTSPTFAISGSMSLVAATVWSATGAITFNATTTGKTITTNGVTLGGSNATVNFNGVGGTWTLGSSLTTGGNVNILSGTLNTSASNYALTAGSGFTTTINGGTLTLNGSTFNPGQTFTFTSGTINPGTSTIVIPVSSATFVGGNQTYYNLSFTSTAITTATISGANTFNNLTIAGKAAAGLATVTFAANQTINGTFTVSAGTDATCRTFFKSDTFNTTRTLTCAAFSATDGDFQDITIAGAAAPASGTRLGDCKGNSGITFPATKTVYWNLSGSQNWSATAWATSSGGSPSVNNFPLAQDTAVFDNTGSTTGTVTIQAAYNIGTLNMSARTSAMTLSASGAPTIYGNWTNGTGLTTSGTGRLTFSGRTTQVLTGAGISNTFATTLDSPSGTLQLFDAWTSSGGSTGQLTLTNGTLDLNGKTYTIGGAGSQTLVTATGTKNITFNGGSIVFTSNSASLNQFNNAAPTGFTTTAGTGTGTISMNGVLAKTFTGGGSTFNCTLNQGGSGALTITGSNTFNNITNTYNATGPTTIIFTSVTTNTFNNWNASGAAGNPLLIYSSSTGTRYTLNKTSGTVNADYITLFDSYATGGAVWNDSPNGVNAANNQGYYSWFFTGGGTVYNVTFTDSSTATDAFAAIQAFLSTIAETATATDTVNAAGSTYNPSLSETATATDAIAGTLTLLAQVAEAAASADTISASFILSSNIAETATATDAVESRFAFAGIILETATATDATSTANNTFNPATAETATATDANSATGAFSPSIAETATATDSPSAKYTANPSVAETTTATDATAGGLLLTSSLSETATATDSLSSQGAFAPSVAETAAVTDATSTANNTFNPTAAETATVTDAPSTANNTFNPSLAETATATDSPAANRTTTGAVSETATATDTTQSAVIFVGAVSETATASDLTSALMTFLGQIAETGTITDITLVAPSVFGPQVQEAITAIDSPAANGIFNVQFVDSATAVDSVIGAYLWNVIDDSQTANWQNINNAQSAGWTVIDISQNPGWTPIDT